MAEPATSSAAGLGFLKFFFPVVFASIGAGMLFMMLPPQTHKEWLQRLVATFICSLVLGPIMYFAFASTGIGSSIIATAVREVAGTYILIPFTSWGLLIDSATVKMIIAGPFFMFGGLPGWYVLGWIILALEKRKGKDAVEIVREANGFRKRFIP